MSPRHVIVLILDAKSFGKGEKNLQVQMKIMYSLFICLLKNYVLLKIKIYLGTNSDIGCKIHCHTGIHLRNSSFMKKTKEKAIQK